MQCLHKKRLSKPLPWEGSNKRKETLVDFVQTNCKDFFSSKAGKRISLRPPIQLLSWRLATFNASLHFKSKFNMTLPCGPWAEQYRVSSRLLVVCSPRKALTGCLPGDCGCHTRPWTVLPWPAFHLPLTTLHLSLACSRGLCLSLFPRL